MSLLLLLRNNGPTTTAGYRSYFALWVGGLAVSPAVGGFKPYWAINSNVVISNGISHAS